MYFHLIKSDEDKAKILSALAERDATTIRGILHRWGVTQCESCGYTDSEVLQWVEFGEGKGFLTVSNN